MIGAHDIPPMVSVSFGSEIQAHLFYHIVCFWLYSNSGISESL